MKLEQREARNLSGARQAVRVRARRAALHSVPLKDDQEILSLLDKFKLDWPRIKLNVRLERAATMGSLGFQHLESGVDAGR